jgi:hypothetical protein
LCGAEPSAIALELLELLQQGDRGARSVAKTCGADLLSLSIELASFY